MTIVDYPNDYPNDEATGENWTLKLGDSCERMAEIPDNSIGLSVYSPPFASLFAYSPSVRDLGNSRNREEFFEHYRFIIRENLRITMPGRLACVHVQQLTTTKASHGFMGLTDFRGEVIRAYQAEGWIFFGEVTVMKDPQAQAIRTKSHALMFVTKNRDSAGTRPALADYLLLFKKPGDNPVPIKTGVPERGADPFAVTNDDWIQWANPIWVDAGNHDDEGEHLCPGWFGIRETDTLNERVAREDADLRHICPLQLGFIERCIRLWSNPGETVFSPFAGIGSEPYMAVKLRRRGLGIELKPAYWQTAANNLRALEDEMSLPTLFDFADPEGAST